jgi:hypothetical protein
MRVQERIRVAQDLHSLFACTVAYGAGSYVTVCSGQPAATSARAATSVSSADSAQRSFVLTHSATYRQCTSPAGGSHCAGSWSAFDRFDRAVTAP